MNVAAGAGLRSIHIRVRVDPKAADGLLAVAVKLGCARLRADGHRVVAPERQGKAARLQGLVDPVRHLLAGFGDFVQVLGFSVAERLLLGDLDVNVSGVLDLMPQALERGIQARGAHR